MNSGILPAARPKYGSFCSGYGGLDLAVEHVFGAELAWYAETDPAASRVLARRWTGVANLGDIRSVRWPDVEKVDVLAAGFPCQDISNAGKRAGIRGERSGLWGTIAAAVRVLRPSLVVLENVAALRSRGLSVVVGDLAEIGYDTRWTCLRASAIGAAHQRDRMFLLGVRADSESGGGDPSYAMRPGR